MALKKPSDLFEKKETPGVFEDPEVSPHITESYNKFVDNFETVNEIAEKTKVFEKVDELSERVEFLSKELSEKLTRTDLENAMLSQLMVLDENFKTIQSQVKGLNKEDLREFRSIVSNLSQVVDNLVENELPKYKNQVVKGKIFVGEQVQELQGIVEENITGIREEIVEKFDNIAEVIDNNLEYFNNQLQETSSKVKKTTETYNNLSKIVENKIAKENERFEEYSQVIEELQETFIELQKSLNEEIVSYQETIQGIVEEKIETVSSDVNAKIDNFISDTEEIVQDFRSEISNVKTDVVIFEKHNRDTEKTIQEFSEELSKISKIDESIHTIEENVELLQSQYEVVSNATTETKKDLELIETYIQSRRQDIVDLKEEVFSEIEKLPVGNLQENLKKLEKKIDYIKETYSKIEPEVIVKEVIKEGLLNEPPDTKNSDSLTPFNQNFVTLDQLQQHYRLFLNRIQQQLSTLGGGGEVRLEFLDDIDRDSAKVNGRYLRYDSASGKWIGATAGGGGGSQTLDDTLGLGNTSSLGMSVGVVTATSFYGNGSNLTGIVTSITAGSGISIDQTTGNVTITATGGGGGGESYWVSTSAGIHTLSNVGVGTTAKNDFKLFVEGNAKVTGILTVGNQSVTIDGSNNIVNVGSGVTIDGNTGIISATTIYVGGSQVSTFSGNYNDLTNKPDLSAISVAYATTSGIATYATSAGIATYATSAGIATYASNAGIATYASNAGIATYASNAGIATYASNAGIATALQNARTFEITGDVLGSAVSFDGTGNVSIAATIQPNSVSLGGDTTGDYVQTITGTSNQITVTSGTGESSTPTLSIPSQFTAPQDVTVTRDLQVNRDLNVNGNITIGGTSATLFSQELKVFDPDIVLGFRTDALGNDISTDNTANHGGIAIASTEGTPLIQLYDVGIGETNPATYKKFMWFKSGTFSGLGTDAWISNYAIGIGSTQFPSGTILAVGSVQFIERDLSVVRNINASGVVTATTFVGSLTGTATNLADAANITTGTINSARLSGNYDINVSYATTAGISTVAQGLTGTPNITVGVVTATSFVKSGGTSSQFLKADGSVDSSTYLTTTGSGTNLTGIVTSIVAGDNITISGSTGQVTITATGGGGGSTLGIATAGGTVGTGVTLLDFRGAGISTVAVSSGIATINIEGGGGSTTPEISSVMMSMIF